MLNVLRNPAYVGKIAFRDVRYDAPHAALIAADVFAKAQRLLRTRGEDAPMRRSSTTDFLLSGLVVCATCDRRYIGTAAHGRNARYPYYTCFSRNRHGRQGCRSDVLRADLLKQAVLESLLTTYADTEVVSAAIERLAHTCGRARTRFRIAGPAPGSGDLRERVGCAAVLQRLRKRSAT